MARVAFSGLERLKMIHRIFILAVIFILIAPTSRADIKATFVSASDVELENPHDLKLSPDGTQLFVSDVGNNRVVVLDPETLELIYTFGADHQAGTHDVDFDKDGNAYIADTHNNRVAIYKIQPKTATYIGELKGGFRGPEGVLLHPNGRVYIAGAWSNNVVAFENGMIVHELTGLSSPHDLELNQDGNIWLADANNDRLALLSPSLQIKRSLKGPPYNFDGVRYLDILANGTIVAADKNNHQVKFIDPNDNVVLILGSGSPGKGPNVFTTPEGVEIKGKTLWLSDSGNDRIVKYKIDD